MHEMVLEGEEGYGRYYCTFRAVYGSQMRNVMFKNLLTAWGIEQ